MALFKIGKQEDQIQKLECDNAELNELKKLYVNLDGFANLSDDELHEFEGHFFKGLDKIKNEKARRVY